MTLAEVKEGISRLKTIYPFEDWGTEFSFHHDLRCHEDVAIALRAFDEEKNVEVTMIAYPRQK